MFEFSSPLFWYKLVFMTELLLAEGLATYTLKKRSNFALRVILSVFGVYAATFLLPVVAYNAFYTSVMFIIMFGFTLAAMLICYREPWLNIVFCGIIAYTAQHISYELYSMFARILDISNPGFVYGSTIMPNESNEMFSVMIYAGVYFAVYWVIWAFVERRIRLQEDLKIEHAPLFVFAIVIIAVDIVLGIVVTYIDTPPDTVVLYIIINVYNILSCALALGMQFSMLGKRLAEKELEAVRNLWEQDKKQYEMSKENIELINVKCHDLKHQIRTLRQSDGEIDTEALENLAREINIYDNTVKTGCDVLDIVLAEKSLQLERRHIRLMCIADGEKLNFIAKSDLYSLFGNAVSNAIEAVGAIEDEDKRFIRLKIDTVGSMISVHLENCCETEPEFVGGLPRTTKEDKNSHGYGMRSMQLLAEKYGGALTCTVEDGMFNLDMVLPLPDRSGDTANQSGKSH